MYASTFPKQKAVLILVPWFPPHMYRYAAIVLIECRYVGLGYSNTH